jgi:hypothetical protein
VTAAIARKLLSKTILYPYAYNATHPKLSVKNALGLTENCMKSTITTTRGRE